MFRRNLFILFALTLASPLAAKSAKKVASTSDETAPPCQLVRLEHTVKEYVYTFTYEIRDENNLVLWSYPGGWVPGSEIGTAIERLQKSGICGKVKLVRRDDFSLPE